MAHIGNINERISIKATLKKICEYSTQFRYRTQYKTIYIFETDNGDILKWDTSALMGFDELDEEGNLIGFSGVDVNDVFMLTGRVKKHVMYRENPQTEITRCKYELIAKALNLDELKKKVQMNSLADGDFIWKQMPYKQYKEHYSDCETVIDSYVMINGKSYIDVIIPQGRLKNSGVRGKHFKGYEFKKKNGGRCTFRAVCEDNAKKQFVKEFGEEPVECVHIFF